MRDLMDEISKGTDTRLKAQGAKLTRLDLLTGQLNRAVSALDTNRKLMTIVYDGDELVEKVVGTIDDAKEIMEYYNQNFVLSIRSRRQLNAIVIRLLKPITKNADEKEEE